MRRLSLRSEGGIAMPVVMGTMLVLSLLAGGLLTTAVSSSSSATIDSSSKRALGAAEAGLQTAALRLKKLYPASNMCMVTPTVANPTGAVAPSPNTTDGTCPASTPEAVSEGVTFTYWVTPRGATCNRLPSVPTSTYDRCITSVGIANGVRRRLQVRVESGPNLPFAKAGLAGIDRVNLINKVTIEETDVGSNGPITMTGSPNEVKITAGNGTLGQARPYVPGGSVIRTGTTSIAGGIANQSSPYQLTQPDFAATLTPAQGGTGTNNNDLLTTRFGASRFNAATRVLTIGANEQWKSGSLGAFPTGTFNLCGMTLASGSEVNLANSTAKANIYVDSPLRPGSGCAAGTGTFTSNSGKMNNGISDRNYWFWVYGTTAPTDALPATGSTADIRHLGTSHIDAVWYAPYSRFYAGGTAITVHGAVAAREIWMQNNVIAGFDIAVAQEVGPGAGPVIRRGFFECKAIAPVVSDPESGC